jgi:NO-binding membrane sensor protein with MHYT domain/nitrogen-specific signal transduction histidine kinase
MVVPERFDLSLVILSVVIAAAASYTALDLAGRILASRERARLGWLILAAVAMGGGIWSMHFVAMLAFVMPMPVTYDIGLTVLSLVVAIAVTGMGFFAVSREGGTWRGIAIGGLLMGTGICAMHYIGMAAMRMQAALDYDPLLVGVSFLIAAGASVVALRLALASMSVAQRVGGAAVMGVAIAGMHYTGMAAATFTMGGTFTMAAGAMREGGTAAAGLSSLPQINLAIAVAVVTFLVLFSAVVSSIVDRRLAASAAREAQSLRDSEERLRKLYDALQRETAQREHVEAALRQAQKMESVGQLTGGIAHDFNNILTVIIGNLDMLTEGLGEQEQMGRIARTAMRSAERAADLVTRLLAFGRRQTLFPESIDVNPMVVHTTEVLGRTLGEAVDIQTILAGKLWGCFADRNQLESALLNLALNARDAMPNGGKLTIQTANMHFSDSETARYEGIEPGEYVMLSVSDSGTGIPKANLGKVFDPFFTTKEIGKGSGLGLAQVYGFVKQSGGHVTIYSEIGIGTTVRIYLPRQREREEAAPPVPRGDVPRARAGERILVVEDDDAVRDYTARTLEGLGYRVLEAEDAIAALRVIDAGRDLDLMFTDVGLPGMNGRKLAETVARLRPALKILYTTGYAGMAWTEEGTLGRDAAVLQKPFNREALAARIREMLDGGARG